VRQGPWLLGFMDANNLIHCNETDTNNAPGDGGIPESSSSQENQDFDDSANALWLLYGKEAKGYDEATIQSIKDDMDGVLIFVRVTFHSSGSLPMLMDRPTRRAYFLLSSPHLSSIVLRIYNRVLRNSRLFSSNNQSYCLTRSPSSFPLLVHRPLSYQMCRSQALLSVRQRLTSG
jgi:hypothetical protein